MGLFCGSRLCPRSPPPVHQIHRGAPFAADDRSYGGLKTLVGAVRGREHSAAVSQTHRGAPFAADDRSYGALEPCVGAVRGREHSAAVSQTHRGAPFAADDRSYEPKTSRNNLPRRSGPWPRKERRNIPDPPQHLIRGHTPLQQASATVQTWHSSPVISISETDTDSYQSAPPTWSLPATFKSPP